MVATTEITTATVEMATATAAVEMAAATKRYLLCYSCPELYHVALHIGEELPIE